MNTDQLDQFLKGQRMVNEGKRQISEGLELLEPSIAFKILVGVLEDLNRIKADLDPANDYKCQAENE